MDIERRTARRQHQRGGLPKEREMSPSVRNAALLTVMDAHTPVAHPTLEQILAADTWARDQAGAMIRTQRPAVR